MQNKHTIPPDHEPIVKDVLRAIVMQAPLVFSKDGAKVKNIDLLSLLRGALTLLTIHDVDTNFFSLGFLDAHLGKNPDANLRMAMDKVEDIGAWNKPFDDPSPIYSIYRVINALLSSNSAISYSPIKDSIEFFEDAEGFRDQLLTGQINAQYLSCNRLGELADDDVVLMREYDSMSIALWSDAYHPPKLELFLYFKDNTQWAFWRDWYQGFLDGKPLDWNLQRAVALIPDADWGKGAAHIAELIEEIRKTYDRKSSAEPSLEDQLKSVSTKAKSTISQNITLNRDALAVSIAGLNEQLTAFREKVRGLNHLDPDFRVELLDYLKELSEHLTCLLRDLPKTDDPISDKQAGKFVLWLREFKPLITQKSRAYISPDNVSDAVIPTGIILGCTGIGSMLGMPLAGAAVGGLITGQIKPGKAASDLFKSDKPDTGEE